MIRDESPAELDLVIYDQTLSSDSLQSPHDPDATYGHKGKGYEVQISETCDDDNPYQVITGTAVNGAHESDQNALLPMMVQLEESKMLPEDCQADTGYGGAVPNNGRTYSEGLTLSSPREPNRPSGGGRVGGA